MTDFGSESEIPYGGRERRRSEPIESIVWSWPRRFPQPESASPEVSPEVEGLLTDLERDLEEVPPSEADELRDERELARLQERLEAMGVEDPKSLDIDKFRDIGNLIFAAYSLEDIHFQVYSMIRANDPSRYVSVTVKNIMDEMPSDDDMPTITRIQKRQTLAAANFSVKLGISRDELVDVVTNGTKKEKYELRCFHRLMGDWRMESLVRDLRIERQSSVDDHTVEYGNVVYNALQVINTAYQNHINYQPTTRDGKLGYRLEQRDLIRALSFANPLIGISSPE